MTIFLFLIFFLLIYIKRYIYVYLGFKKFKTKYFQKDNKSDNKNNIFVILPALSEQSIVEETIDHFNNMHESEGIIHYIIVTTQREEIDKKKNEMRLSDFIDKVYENPQKIYQLNNGLFPHYLFNKILELKQINTLEKFKIKINKLYSDYPTTNSKIKEYLNKIKLNFKFDIINYPGSTGNKSSQLNYALSYIKETYSDLFKHSIIGIYDFDSKPDVRTFGWINENYSVDSNIKVYQQIPLPILGLNKDKKFFENYLLIIFHLLHIRRSLGVELNMHSNNNYNNNFSMLKYCMGAGLFINAKTLDDINGYPEPIDDIPLGYRISLKKIETEFIPFFNLVYSTNRIKFLIGQSRNIVHGLTFGLFKELRETDTNFSNSLKYMKSILSLIDSFLSTTLIMISFFLMIFLLIRQDFTVLFILLTHLFSYSLLYILIYKICNSIIRNYYMGTKINPLNFTYVEHLILILLSPFRGYFRFFIILKGIIYLLFKKIYEKNQFHISKTER